MQKNITILDESLTEEFISLLSIGLIDALKKKIITPQRAEQWLFSPVLAYSLASKEFSKELKYALEYASETDAASYCSNPEKSLNFNQELFSKIIENVPKNSFDGKSFIEGIID